MNLKDDRIRIADPFSLTHPISASPFLRPLNACPSKGVFYFLNPGYCGGMKKLLKKTTIRVFLCHAHADRDVVRRLYARLKRDHIEPWLDREALLPGQNWAHEIRKAILGSDAVLVCLSQGFNSQHGYRHEELMIALNRVGLFPVEDIFIIPVRLEKCETPISLSHLHHVDLFEKDGYEKLLAALQK